MSTAGERLEVAEVCPGVDLYRVHDARTGRTAVAGFYDTSDRSFHKFVKSERGIQRAVNKKPLLGFGIQENAFQHLLWRGCERVYIHYTPSGVVHESAMALWVERGLLASYAGRQRFLGILTLNATKLVAEAEQGRHALTRAEIDSFETEERQMFSRDDFTPAWLQAEEPVAPERSIT